MVSNVEPDIIRLRVRLSLALTVVADLLFAPFDIDILFVVCLIFSLPSTLVAAVADIEEEGAGVGLSLAALFKDGDGDGDDDVSL